MPSPERLEHYGPFMAQVAQESGEIIRAKFLAPLRQELKDDETPVTEVDRAVNSHVSQRIAESFPDHGFLGEEGDSHQSESSHLWICDPLDGTRPFINGIPVGAFALALKEEDELVTSVVHDPFMGRTVFTAKGEGAWSDGKRLHVSEQQTLSGADIHTCWGKTDYLGRIDRLRKFGAKVIKMDATVYAGMLVSQGRLDADIYPGEHLWDVAAQTLAIKEAGGQVTDMRGNELTLHGRIDGAILSNKRLHDDIIRFVIEGK